MSQQASDLGQEDPATAPLSRVDRLRLQQIKRSLDWGVDAKRWWDRDTGRASAPALDQDGFQAVLRSDMFEQVSPLAARSEQEGEHDFSFAFYHTATFGNQHQPLVGQSQQMFFDRPKHTDSETIDHWRQNLREFVLKYFMRIVRWRPPAPHVEQRRPLSRYLKLVSMCPEEVDDQSGFSYTQIYYQRADGRYGRFPRLDQDKVVDLRKIDERDGYQWIVVRLGMEDFKLEYRPISQLPFVTVPLVQVNHVVVGPSFIICEEEPTEDGLLARYGFGYAMLRDPTAGGPAAYGPAKFDGAFAQIEFCLLTDGTIVVRATYVIRRPSRTFNLPVNPIDWGFALAERIAPRELAWTIPPLRSAAGLLPFGRGFDPFLAFSRLLDAVSAGQAARQLCTSRESIERRMMFEGFANLRDMLLGAHRRWRQVRDWTDDRDPGLPSWLR